MPLLRRKRFSLEPPPANLRTNEELFYVQATGEVFRDYKYVSVCYKVTMIEFGVCKFTISFTRASEHYLEHFDSSFPADSHKLYPTITSNVACMVCESLVFTREKTGF